MDEPGQTSPFQALLERAIAQEMAQPQGRYVTTTKGNYRYGGPRTVMDNMMREHTYIDHGEPNDLAALASAGAQNDAAANAQRGQRLTSMLGGLGQYAGAQAQMTQAQAEKAKLDWLMSPAGQKFILTGKVVDNTQNPASDPIVGPMIGAPPIPGVALGKAVGNKPGVALPPTPGEFAKQYNSAGGKPLPAGDPLRSMLNQEYGAAAVRGQRAGNPSGFMENLQDAPFTVAEAVLGGSLGRAAAARNLRVRTERAEPLNSMLRGGAAAPAAVGLSRPAGPPPTPGVRSQGLLMEGEAERQRREGKRKERVEATKGGKPLVGS